MSRTRAPMEATKRIPSALLAVVLCTLCALAGCNLETPRVEHPPTGNGGEAGGEAVADTNALIAQARQAIVNNRVDLAYGVLNPLIEREPNNAAAFSLRGIAYMREGKVYPAVRDLKAAADLSPSADAYFNLGNALQQAGFYERAQSAYRAALELAPEDPEILNNYGASLLHDGRTHEAIAALQRVTALRPNDPEAYTNLGMAHHIDEDFQAAEQQYRRALEVDPDYFQAVFNMAQIYQTQGNDARATQYYKRYLEMRPNAPDRKKILNRAGLLSDDLQM